MAKKENFNISDNLTPEEIKNYLNNINTLSLDDFKKLSNNPNLPQNLFNNIFDYVLEKEGAENTFNYLKNSPKFDSSHVNKILDKVIPQIDKGYSSDFLQDICNDPRAIEDKVKTVFHKVSENSNTYYDVDDIVPTSLNPEFYKEYVDKTVNEHKSNENSLKFKHKVKCFYNGITKTDKHNQKSLGDYLDFLLNNRPIAAINYNGIEIKDHSNILSDFVKNQNNLTKDQLDKIIQSEYFNNHNVKNSVLAHKNVDPVILSKYANLGDVSAISNGLLPRETLESIINEPNISVDILSAALDNPNITTEDIEKIYENNKDGFDLNKLGLIVQNPKTPEHIISDIWQRSDKGTKISQLMLKSDNLPENILVELASSKNEQIAKLALKHKSVSANVLNAALNGKNESVKDLAKKHPLVADIEMRKVISETQNPVKLYSDKDYRNFIENNLNLEEKASFYNKASLFTLSPHKNHNLDFHDFSVQNSVAIKDLIDIKYQLASSPLISDEEKNKHAEDLIKFSFESDNLSSNIVFKYKKDIDFDFNKLVSSGNEYAVSIAKKINSFDIVDFDTIDNPEIIRNIYSSYKDQKKKGLSLYDQNGNLISLDHAMAVARSKIIQSVHAPKDVYIDALDLSSASFSEINDFTKEVNSGLHYENYKTFFDKYIDFNGLDENNRAIIFRKALESANSISGNVPHASDNIKLNVILSDYAAGNFVQNAFDGFINRAKDLLTVVSEYSAATFKDSGYIVNEILGKVSLKSKSAFFDNLIDSYKNKAISVHDLNLVVKGLSDSPIDKNIYKKYVQNISNTSLDNENDFDLLLNINFDRGHIGNALLENKNYFDEVINSCGENSDVSVRILGNVLAASKENRYNSFVSGIEKISQNLSQYNEQDLGANFSFILKKVCKIKPDLLVELKKEKGNLDELLGLVDNQFKDEIAELFTKLDLLSQGEKQKYLTSGTFSDIDDFNKEEGLKIIYSKLFSEYITKTELKDIIKSKHFDRLAIQYDGNEISGQYDFDDYITKSKKIADRVIKLCPEFFGDFIFKLSRGILPGEDYIKSQFNASKEIKYVLNYINSINVSDIDRKKIIRSALDFLHGNLLEKGLYKAISRFLLSELYQNKNFFDPTLVNEVLGDVIKSGVLSSKDFLGIQNYVESNLNQIDTHNLFKILGFLPSKKIVSESISRLNSNTLKLSDPVSTISSFFESVHNLRVNGDVKLKTDDIIESVFPAVYGTYGNIVTKCIAKFINTDTKLSVEKKIDLFKRLPNIDLDEIINIDDNILRWGSVLEYATSGWKLKSFAFKSDVLDKNELDIISGRVINEINTWDDKLISDYLQKVIDNNFSDDLIINKITRSLSDESLLHVLDAFLNRAGNYTTYPASDRFKIAYILNSAAERLENYSKNFDKNISLVKDYLIKALKLAGEVHVDQSERNGVLENFWKTIHPALLNFINKIDLNTQSGKDDFNEILSSFEKSLSIKNNLNEFACDNIISILKHIYNKQPNTLKFNEIMTKFLKNLSHNLNFYGWKNLLADFKPEVVSFMNYISVIKNDLIDHINNDDLYNYLNNSIVWSNCVDSLKSWEKECIENHGFSFITKLVRNGYMYSDFSDNTYKTPISLDDFKKIFCFIPQKDIHKMDILLESIKDDVKQAATVAAISVGAVDKNLAELYIGKILEEVKKDNLTNKEKIQIVSEVLDSPIKSKLIVELFNEVISSAGDNDKKNLIDKVVNNQYASRELILSALHHGSDYIDSIYDSLIVNPQIDKDLFFKLARNTDDKINFIEPIHSLPASYKNVKYGLELLMSKGLIAPKEGVVPNISNLKLVTTASPKTEKSLKIIKDLQNIIHLIPVEGISWQDFKKIAPDSKNKPYVKDLFMSKNNKLILPEDVIDFIKKIDSSDSKDYFYVTYSFWNNKTQKHLPDHPNLIIQINNSIKTASKFADEPKLWNLYQYILQGENNIDDLSIGIYPITPHAIGLARIDTSGGENGWVIEDFQSDFVQKFKKELPNILDNITFTPKIGNNSVAKYYISELVEQIYKIIDGWNLALLDAIKRNALAHGVKKIFMHGIGVKSVLSFENPRSALEKDNMAYLKERYYDFPKNNGFKECEYRDYPQTNSRMMDLLAQNNLSSKCWVLSLNPNLDE